MLANRAIGSFLGSVKRIQQLVPVEVRFGANGLGLFESHHEEGFFMDWRQDPFAKILIVIGEGAFSSAEGSRWTSRLPAFWSFLNGRGTGSRRSTGPAGGPAGAYSGPAGPNSASRVDAYIQSLEREFWRNETIDSVAASLGMSRRRFTQLFRDIAGESWRSRLNRLRLEHAATLLRGTRLSVWSVVFECGFADLSHFYRAFKGRFGMSPGRWREQA